MNVLNRYHLSFGLTDHTPAVESNKEYAILSHFLMIWDDPEEIISELIPFINKGIKYGIQDRWKTYQEIPGLEQKMMKRWAAEPSIENKADHWNKIKDRGGYYIEEEDAFLEGIDAGVVGVAFVNAEETILSDSDLNFPDLKMSSTDFKEIVLQWLLHTLRNKEILPAA